QGEAEGEARARSDSEREMAALASLLSSQLTALHEDAQARAARIEETALELAVTLARKLGGAALARFPLADIEAMARECFTHARLAPHLVVRVGESQIDEVDRLLGKLAREAGFAGKIVVLGEPDIQLSAARIEWADGGMVVDAAARETAIQTCIDRFFAGNNTSDPTGGVLS
ncbi:MAG: FliH/SctL family protein, partial [Bosea sp. (in: a-proteobacteria)]